MPFSPKGLISYLFPNYNLTLLERPEFLMPKAGRAHLALRREQGPMAFPLSAFAESKQGEVSGMQDTFCRPWCCPHSTCLSPGWEHPLRRLGTEPQAEQGDQAWAGGWKVRGTGCAVHGSPADGVQRVQRG